MSRLLLIQTGEAPESIHARFGGFADWFREALRVEPRQLQVARVDRGDALPPAASVAGAVISGSAAMVTERNPWSEQTAIWIRAAMTAEMPLFGVCYGHQLMAHAMGGEVGWLPAGREMGTCTMRRVADADGWLQELPATFPAHATHRQAVLEAPPGAQLLASSELDPYQFLRYGSCAVSTQFHPEFSAEAMRAYIDTRADALRKEGTNVEALRAAVRETPDARALLARFARLVLSRGVAAA